MQPPRGRVVRVRQRDRANTIPGFDRTLPPRSFDWGIDRFTFTVHGDWRTSEGMGQNFFENRFDDPEFPWLRRPVGRGYTRSVVTRDRSSLTIGRIAISASGCTRQHGQIAVEVNTNPTRTLSALLVRFGDKPDFAGTIGRLSAIEFFQKPSSTQRLTHSLDGNDNYLASWHAVHAILPPDPFEQFMPIYLAKVRDMLDRAIGLVPGESEIDARDQVFPAVDGEIRLNWGTVEVPQVETYFERFHSRAVAAVRTAGISILDSDPHPALRLYLDQSGFERHGDCYVVNLGVTDRHRLHVYAKTKDRIRFEVKRHGRGRYDDIGIGNTPDHRLISILFDVERSEASRLIDWLEVFRQFDEPDIPAIGDLLELISTIVRVANGNEESVRRLMERLIVDGGISPDLDAEIDSAAIAALSRAGIISCVSLRSRRRVSHARRYALTREYASLRQSLLAALTAASDPRLIE